MIRRAGKPGVTIAAGSKSDSLPLDGIRVLDCGTLQSGPACCAILADLGADVIKVESPTGGDSERGARKVSGVPVGLPHGLAYPFEVHNRNKRSVAVDLTKQEGRAILNGLVAIADVFVHNYRPQVAERLGFGFAELARVNPSLVYANCSGFGLKGPRSKDAAVDPIAHAVSGMMLGIGEPDMGPVHLPGAIADQATALMLTCGILACLRGRQITGGAQQVHTSMLGTLLWLQTNNLLVSILAGGPRPRQTRTGPVNPLVNYYRCQDGKWILLAHFQADRYWAALCRALGRSALEKDARFATMQAREDHAAELVAILDDVFGSRAQGTWLKLLGEADLVFAPIQDYWEVIHDPQVLANEYIHEVVHPTVGRLKTVRVPLDLNTEDGRRWAPAPQLGQHTEEILIDTLGYTWEGIAVLKDMGVIL